MEHNLTCACDSITLRPLSIADTEALRKWRNDKEYTKYLSEVPYITEEMQRTWYEKYLKDTDSYAWAIVCDSDAGGIVGSVSLYDFTNDSCEYGRILINPLLNGRGIGTMAERLALHMGFGVLGMERIHTYINIANAAAIRKSEKSGFVKTDEPGHSKSARKYIDHLHMVTDKFDYLKPLTQLITCSICSSFMP